MIEAISNQQELIDRFLLLSDFVINQERVIRRFQIRILNNELKNCNIIISV